MHKRTLNGTIPTTRLHFLSKTAMLFGSEWDLFKRACPLSLSLLSRLVWSPPPCLARYSYVPMNIHLSQFVKCCIVFRIYAMLFWSELYPQGRRARADSVCFPCLACMIICWQGETIINGGLFMRGTRQVRALHTYQYMKWYLDLLQF